MMGNNGWVSDLLETAIADLCQRGRVAAVAEATGIKPKVLRNIRYGVTKNPRYDTVEKLRAYYQIRNAVQKLEALQQGEQQAAWQHARKQHG
jgi:hypothetical protein